MTLDNLELYNTERVVAYFDSLSGLQPVERYVFEKYVSAGMRVVDIGVGAGRTTPWLAERASRYLGVDYSSAMIDVCKAKYPKLEFKHGDATDLSFIPDSAFDAAIFSFNGIDCIPTDRGRLQCLSEMRRIVKPGGVVIFSSHNAKRLGEYPVFNGATVGRKAWRTVRAVVRTPALALRALQAKAFRDGAGYVFDPSHGGAVVFTSTPTKIAHDAHLAGLSVVEIVGGHYPARVSQYLTNWYYYVLRASADAGGGG